MRYQGVFVLLLVAVFPTLAFSIQSTDLVGWYWDPQATTRCLSASAFDEVTAYLCITHPAHTDSIYGWELSATIDGNCYVDFTLEGDAFNIATPPDFLVGMLADPLSASSQDVVVLCRATILLLDNNPISLYVNPLDGGTLPGQMIYAFGHTGGDLVSMYPSSGDTSVAAAWANSESWPCNSTEHGSEYHVIVKAKPGVITINNETGGDFAGNVDINSSCLDDAITEFQVEEIRKYTGAYPDTINYFVRVTNEPYTSYDLRNLFVLTLPDSTYREAIIDSLQHCEELLYSYIPALYGEWSYIPVERYDNKFIVNSVNPDICLDLPDAWESTTAFLDDPLVVVIDSGIDALHPDLLGHVIGDQFWDETHGTGVAGIITAIHNNSYAVAGVSQAKVYEYTYPEGKQDFSLFAGVVQEVLELDIPIANFSGAWNGDVTPYGSDFDARNICAEYWNSNRLFFAAAHNAGNTAPMWPASFRSVICVGSIDYSGAKTSFSCYGPYQDFMAFGYRDTILFPTSATAELEDHCMVASGTSLASPAAAAIASMLLAIRPSLYNDDVINIMKLSCYTDLVDPPPGISFEFYYGAGLLQANAAIELLLTNALYGDVIATGPDDVEEIHDGIIEHVGNVPGLPMGAYDVYKYACFANATFPVSFLYPPHVWGRSVGTVGVGPFTELKPYSYSEFDKTHYCGVIDSTVTATSCQLLTYTYRFIDQSQQEHWFPCHYDSVVFSYAALGKDGIVAVEDNTPSVYSIRAFPNPFNAAVKISLYAIRSSEADVSVYNIRGEKVTTLHRGILLRGLHELNWDGRDNNDRICASGTYIIRIDDGIRAQRVQVAFVK